MFTAPFGCYCYRRLPISLTTASEYSQCFMSRLLEGTPGVVNMIDDTLIFGSVHQKQDKRLVGLLSCLNQVGVTLNEKKCQFLVSSVKLMRVVVDVQEISADPDDVKAIKDLPLPVDVSGAYQLLGMTNDVACFIPNMSDISTPICSLLNKDLG